MKVLAVDIGTGTQDVLLFDSRLEIENGYKMILPSPTMQVRRAIQAATQRSEPILLTGVTMGGGPSAWAVEAHLKAGLTVFATPAAARTLNDDLQVVTGMGVRLVSDEEAAHLPETVRRIAFKDFDFQRLASIFKDFGVDLGDLAAVAVAVFDHGEAPPGVSDRKFRFDYLSERLQGDPDLRTFAHPVAEIPPVMSRMQAVVSSAANLEVPLMVMDSAPAAILGALYDQTVQSQERNLLVNIGNFHTTAFRVHGTLVEGLLEHHTGFLDHKKLEKLLVSLADGSLSNDTVFSENGHGALILDKTPYPLDREGYNLAVTGPRRSLLTESSIASFTTSQMPRLRPYFAVPFGDMMTSGCIGLLSGLAYRIPSLAGPIINALEHSVPSLPPWEA